MFLWILSGILAFHAFLVSYIKHQKTAFLNSKNVLIVTAHPDDECMFFGPVILYLVGKGLSVHLLCLSNGNADGLGKVREKELIQSTKILGISNVTVLDHPKLQDGMTNHWDSGLISSIVLKKAQSLDIDTMITFDDYGVSGHANHRAIGNAHYHGFKGSIWTLDSVSIFRKFNSFFDLLPSLWYSQDSVLLFHGPWTTIRAMAAHQSQLVWFRYLYISLSRYMILNSLTRK